MRPASQKRLRRIAGALLILAADAWSYDSPEAAERLAAAASILLDGIPQHDNKGVVQ